MKPSGRNLRSFSNPSRNSMNTRRGFLSLLVSGIIYSTFGILIRFAGESYQTFGQVFFRCLVTVVIAVAIALIQKKKLKLPEENRLVMTLFLLSPSFSIACLTYAITTIKAANGIFFLYAGYITTTIIFGALFYKEQLNKPKLVAIALALIGIFLFSFPFGSGSWVGMVFAILAGFGDALSSTICKRLGSADSVPLIFWRYLVGVGVAFLVILLLHEPITLIPSMKSVIALGLLGSSLFAIDSLWLYGFSHFDLNIGSIVTSIELAIVPIINAVVLSEYPTQFEVYGGICIMMAIVLINTFAVRKKVSFMKIHQRKNS